MGLKFAILYEGKTEKGKKMVKSLMDWPESTVLKMLKKNFEATNDLEKAFKQTIKDFKRKSVKIP